MLVAAVIGASQRPLWTSLIIVRTINMQLKFDPGKEVRNRAKHGLSLSVAERLDWNSMLARVDDRQDYGEERWVGVAPYGARLYTVVFTLEDEDIVRVISLRRSTNREIEHYEGKDRT
jgi:uncharacterized protein